MLQKIVRKCKKIYQIGPSTCIRIAANRAMIRRFAKAHKQTALEKKAATTWDLFIKTHPEFTLQAGLIFLDSLAVSFDQNEILAYAENIIQNKHHLFNQEVLFVGDARWHTDFLLQDEGGIDCTFDSDIYFNEAIISIGQTKQRVKDIRVVWELSRLHLLMPLGKAFLQTHDQRYATYFQELIIDWHEHNPYLLGVHWVCPMEVGIRAINMIVAYSYFKDATIDASFWRMYVSSLYDHMNYLEHTWEYYDGRTSNHYLSDLVGYAYLCYFFKNLKGMQKKRDWVVSEIIVEFDKQVFPEGASYEGSTTYHALVTELFLLFELLCVQEHISLPQSFYQKYTQMFVFADACFVNDTYMIAIGDNDSGKVLWSGLPYAIVKAMSSKIIQERNDFLSFGLSVIKNSRWHVSLRHHAYQKQQPSGHFHNDVGSITLALYGVPILVDPGSFCYTASTYWRNYFRSASGHNSVHSKDCEPVVFNERLFALNLQEKQVSSVGSKKKLTCNIILSADTTCNFDREISVYDNVVFIKDVSSKSSFEHEDIKLFFNFTFSQDVELRKEENAWLILVKNRPICIFESELDFEQVFGLASDNYGSKIPVMRLQAECLWQPEKIYISQFKSC